MSYFTAKMHQIRFSPDPLAGFKGPTSKGRGGEGMGGEGQGWEGVAGKGWDGTGEEGREEKGEEEREGKERGRRVPKVTPSKKILDPTLQVAKCKVLICGVTMSVV